MTERLARACSSHPWRTLGGWGLAVVASVALAVTSLSGLASDQHVTGKPESAKAADVIAQAFPPSAAERKRTVSDVIVVSSKRHTTDSPAFRGFVAQLTGRVRAAATDVGAQNYLGGDRSLVAPSRHATVIQLNAPSDSSIEPVVSLVKKASTQDFAVAITGDRTVNNDFAKLSQTDLQNGELFFGLPAAMIVLVLVFGAVVAGLVPVVMALLSILVGLGLVALLSLEFDLSVFIVNMLSGMGLALGIDYSLFIVSRYREERSRGAAKERAITLAGATASRAVLFSGTTFVVALFGMLIVPTSIMRSLAAGAIIVGLVSVSAALTLLPALLGLVGDHVNSLPVPFLGRNLGRADSAEGRFWRAIVERVLRRPALSLMLGVAVMLAAAFPIFGLHIGASGVSSLPDKLASKQGYLALQREFPVQNPYPARIVVDGGQPAAVRRDLAKLERRLAADPRFGAGTIESSTVLPVSMLSVPVRGDEVGSKAIAAVRD
ncbi:MAG TPA: MMPL family transporter, partial [Gaiellaceae bacterium]